MNLLVACPAYKAMAEAPKSLKMSRLQSSIDKFLGKWGIEHLIVIVTPEMFTIFASMQCHRVGTESLTSGLFRNSFLWEDYDE